MSSRTTDRRYWISSPADRTNGGSFTAGCWAPSDCPIIGYLRRPASRRRANRGRHGTNPAPKRESERSVTRDGALTSIRSRERVHREHPGIVGPGFPHLPVGTARQCGEALEAVFVATLGVDA